MGQVISAPYDTKEVDWTDIGRPISKVAPGWCWLSHGSSVGLVCWWPLIFATRVFPFDCFSFLRAWLLGFAGRKQGLADA